MPDEPTPVATPAVTPGSTSTPGGSTTTPPEPQAGDGQEQLSLDEARKLRREAQELRRRIKAYDDAQAEAEKAKLSESERLAKEYADLQTRNENLAAELMEAHVNQDIAKLASKFNFAVSPDLVARLIDWSELEWNEETGHATNIERLLEKLAKAEPTLLGRAAPTSGGATNPSRQAATQAGQITADFVNKLTSGQLPPGTYEALPQAQKDEVLRLMSQRSGKVWY